MKFFHTADWHLGKIVQGVHMTEDQAIILEQFIEAVKKEKPDAVIIAGDLYDRPIPPTEAVQLLDDVLSTIVLDLHTPVIAIAGNHDSPSRLHFANKLMREKGFYVIGQFDKEQKPVVIKDEHGEVHIHLVPYADPSIIRHMYDDDSIQSHDDATKKIVDEITSTMDDKARHIYVGHAFVTPYGEAEENTSESERPLSIGGAEYVRASHFSEFDYTALGHLHRAHYVSKEEIRYAGSPLKFSISEANQEKGFYIARMDEQGHTTLEKQTFTPRRDMRRIEAMIDDILKMEVSEDYVFVTLLDDAPVLSPMEKIRTIFPNAMHVVRKHDGILTRTEQQTMTKPVKELTDSELFQAFYKEVKGFAASEVSETIFTKMLHDLNQSDYDDY